MHLEKLLNEYIRFNNISPATIRTYNYVITLFEKDTGIGDITEITSNHICEWKENVLLRAKPSTWNNYRRHMRALLNFAIKRKYIKSNWFTDVKPAVALAGSPKHCKTKDIVRILEALDKDIYYPGWFWKIVIKTFYYTGMRRRQLCGLIWRDLEYNQKQILLRASTSKTNRQWHIPLDDRLVPDLILLYQETYAKRGYIKGNEQVFDLSLFNKSYQSNELTGEHVTMVFKRIGKKLNIRFSPHMIRHNFGTQTGRNISNIGSMELITLKNQLGHTNLSTTTQYIFPSIEPQRLLVKNLEDI